MYVYVYICLYIIVFFKRLDSRQNELKMCVISIWTRFEWILCKTNTRRTCNDLDCTEENLNADRPPLKRNRPIGYYELQVS